MPLPDRGAGISSGAGHRMFESIKKTGHNQALPKTDRESYLQLPPSGKHTGMPYPPESAVLDDEPDKKGYAHTVTPDLLWSNLCRLSLESP